MANIKVEIDANIKTKLLTLSFQRSARTRISPMSIIKNGTRARSEEEMLPSRDGQKIKLLIPEKLKCPAKVPLK